jgi:hypothetical protein
MKALRIVHSGSVNADGFILKGAEPQMRLRALHLYRRGMRMYRHRSHLIVLLESPLPVDALRAPGIPLVRMFDRYLGAPLEEEAAKTLPLNSVAYYEGGKLAIIAEESLSIRQETDPLDWLDLSNLTYLETSVPTAVELPSVYKPETDSRRALGIPPAVAGYVTQDQRKERSKTGTGDQSPTRLRNGAGNQKTPLVFSFAIYFRNSLFYPAYALPIPL